MSGDAVCSPGLSRVVESTSRSLRCTRSFNVAARSAGDVASSNEWRVARRPRPLSDESLGLLGEPAANEPLPKSPDGLREPPKRLPPRKLPFLLPREPPTSRTLSVSTARPLIGGDVAVEDVEGQIGERRGQVGEQTVAPVDGDFELVHLAACDRILVLLAAAAVAAVSDVLELDFHLGALRQLAREHERERGVLRLPRRRHRLQLRQRERLQHLNQIGNVSDDGERRLRLPARGQEQLHARELVGDAGLATPHEQHASLIARGGRDVGG